MMLYRIIAGYFISCFFLGCLHTTPVHAASLSRERIVDLYTQAKDLFREADASAAHSPKKARTLYEKAAMRYERIIEEGGVHNGRLFYNLGNIYFRLKDMGGAILNYRKAQQYMPNDPNLKQNLAYARKLRQDDIQEKQETLVLKTLFFWHYDLSVKIRLVVFTLCFIFFWVSAGMRIFIKKIGLGWCLVITAILSMFLAASLIAEEVSLRRNRPGVIIFQQVIARKGNSKTYKPSFKKPLHAGTEFTLIEDRGDWVQIELADARTCWVPAKAVAWVR